MSYRVRPALAEDAELAHAWVYASAPEVFEYLLAVGGHTPKAFLHSCFADGAGVFGHRNHRVVESEGRPVGVGAFYDALAQRQMSAAMGRQIFDFYGWLYSLGVFYRGVALSRFIPPVDEAMVYIGHFCVAPEWRGRGVGTCLLEDQIAVAREKGYRVAALDVAETNPRAEKLYRGLGFEAVQKHVLSPVRFRREAAARVPAGIRMELRL